MPSIVDHASALAFLEKGRNPRSHRPVANNTWVVPCTVDGEPAVGVRLHQTIVVAYLPDGRVVLDSGGWRTVTTKDRINRFTSAFLLSRRNEWFVGSHPLGLTPPRISTCRSCKGGGVRRVVNEGTWAYDVDAGRTVYTRFAVPVVSDYPCPHCSGCGQRDYGSTPTYVRFEDGITLDDSGAVLGVGSLPIDRGGTTSGRSRYPHDYYGLDVSPCPVAAPTEIEHSTCRNCETPIERAGGQAWEHSREAPIGSRCWHGDAGPEPCLGSQMRLAEGDLDTPPEIPTTITTMPTETSGDAMRWTPANGEAELASWVELLAELRGTT